MSISNGNTIWGCSYYREYRRFKRDPASSCYEQVSVRSIDLRRQQDEKNKQGTLKKKNKKKKKNKQRNQGKMVVVPNRIPKDAQGRAVGIRASRWIQRIGGAVANDSWVASYDIKTNGEDKYITYSFVIY